MEAKSPKLATEISERRTVQIFSWPDSAVTVDDSGFRVEGVAGVSWSAVVRVAFGYEIHPVAIADWDFWAFRTTDDTRGYWVQTKDLWTTAFSQAVRNRFAITDAPPMRDWQDRNFRIRAYVVWPAANVGEALYVPIRRRRWSWRNRLAYPATPPISQ